MHEIPRILILSSSEEPHSIDLNDSWVRALNGRLAQEAEVEWRNYRDIRLEFDTNRVGAFVQSTGKPLSSFRFVYFKSYVRYSEQAASIAEYLQQADVPFVCSELQHYMPLSKLTQYARLSRAGLPIPQTLYMDARQYGGQFEHLAASLGTPFIFKSIDGKGGHENYLVHTAAELQSALAENPDLSFVAQRFIENDSDLRILVVGKQVQLVIHRKRSGGSHLNNTSQGGTASLLPVGELLPEHTALALQAAALMNREIAGVDLMFETGTGNPYVLEVNASPQIASGAFTEEKLAVYSDYLRNMLE